MKTHKEKAEEFVHEMYGKIDYQIIGTFEKKQEVAKQCAIIAIDEMIIQNGEANLLFKIDKDYYQEVNCYLFQVKQEIEKL